MIVNECLTFRLHATDVKSYQTTPFSVSDKSSWGGFASTALGDITSATLPIPC